jgi:hypothetical protein
MVFNLTVTRSDSVVKQQKICITPRASDLKSSKSWCRNHAIRDDTEDLCEMRINLARELHFGKDIGKLRVAGNPVDMMDTVLLTMTDKVKASFDLLSLAREFAILGNLDGGFIVNHEDGRFGWETLRRFTPLFGAKVQHIVEKPSDVGGSHCGGTYGHIFGLDVDIATGVGMVEFASMRAPLWKIMYLMVERPVSVQSCQLASEKTVRSAYAGMQW